MVTRKIRFHESLGGRMLLFGILPMLLLLVTFILWTTNVAYRDLLRANEQQMAVLAEVVAAEVERGNSRAVLAAEVMALAQQSGMFGDRAASIAYARNTLERFKEFTGVYFGYEPNADGTDSTRLAGIAGRNATDPNGRFIPYWFRDLADGDQLKLEPLVDMETSLYYNGCKELFTTSGRPMPMVTEPYVYEGKLIVEQTYPIVIDGEFKGIAGVDRALDDIGDFLDGIKLRSGVDVFLISRQGRFVESTSDRQDSDENLTSQALQNTAYAELFGPLYQQKDQENFLLGIDPVDARSYYYAAAPVPTGEWLVIIRKLEASVAATTLASVSRILLLGIGGLIFVVFMAVWVMRSTSMRISKVVKVADRLAMGDLSTAETLDANARDETALLNSALNRLVESYREITRICVAIAEGDFSQVFTKRSDHDELADALAEMSEKRRIAEQTVQRARDEAEDANRTKSEFLANMSHELRTPMNAIIGYSEMLEEDALEQELDDFVPDLQKVQKAGKHLLSLINDVLDLSKIEAGRMDLFLETFDIAEMLADVRNTVAPLVENNQNTLEVICDPTIGEMHSDLVKVRQSLINLLSNACKFTEAGVITLSAAPADLDGCAGICFTVSDSGIGMTEEQLKRIFEAFGQADSSTTRRYGGTGLGLTITQSFANLLGGRVEVTSQPGAGSSFSLILPVQSIEQASPETEETRPAEPKPNTVVGKGPLVLVVDDDTAARELLSRTLLQKGFSVVTAANGEQGLILARERQPSVITLDVMMPKLDGWEVLQALKSDPATAGIPVVMVTIMEDQSLAYSLGATDFLTKPVDRELLIKTLRGCGSQQGQTALVVDDEADARELTVRALSREGWRVIEAEHGAEALTRLEKELPDLILLDLMMPVMDGFEFLERMRADERFHHLPVVVLTAKILTQQERAFLEQSVAQVVQKGAKGQDKLIDEIISLTGSENLAE